VVGLSNLVPEGHLVKSASEGEKVRGEGLPRKFTSKNEPSPTFVKLSRLLGARACG